MKDVGRDHKIDLSATLISLNLRSFLCVPLIGWEGRRLGVIQLDCIRQGQAFRADDLELLTAVCLQASVVVENAALYAEHLREVQFRTGIRCAREIQQSFLPTDFEPLGAAGPEVFAHVQPRGGVRRPLRFFPIARRSLGVLSWRCVRQGDAAALFMIAVRTLIRHFAAPVRPAELEPPQRRYCAPTIRRTFM